MKTVRVYTVWYDTDRKFDCVGEIAKFRHRTDAEGFAAKHTCQGRDCEVLGEDVPTRIARRWSIAE